MKIFLDTMIYLHYKSIEEIDFLSEFNTTTLTIVLPRITIREIDKQKNTNNSIRIRERARKILKKIETWIVSKEVRPKVSLEYMATEPKIDLVEMNLNPDWNDDLLIAAILQYKCDNPKNDSVILITQDTGPRLTALHHDIQVKLLPDRYKLPVEPHPLEAENQSLRKRLNSLESALPELAMTFSNTEKLMNNKEFSLPPQPTYREDKTNKITEELILKHPKITNTERKLVESDNNTQSSRDRQLYLNMLGAFGGSIPEEEIERYNVGVDNYIEQYEDYLKARWEVSAALKRSINFELEIWNTGTAPADDVDINIYFPDGFSLLSSEDLPVGPKEPEPPQKPRTEAQMMVSRLTNSTPLSIPTAPDLSNLYNSKTDPFSIKRTNSYEVSNHFQTIKHGSKIIMPEMTLIFDSYEYAKSFKCKYIIRPANLPEPIKGDLHFKIIKS